MATAKVSEKMTLNELGLEVGVDGLPDFSKWEEEQVGFAPYWSPAEEKWFLAQVFARDDRDPDFIRYLMRAGMLIPCKRGAGEDAEDIAVKPGGFFTISVYTSLRDTFDFYLESGIRPFVRIEAIKEVPTKKTGQTCWTWNVKVSPTDKKKLEFARKEKATLLLKEKSMENDAQDFPHGANVKQMQRGA